MFSGLAFHVALGPRAILYFQSLTSSAGLAALLPFLVVSPDDLVFSRRQKRRENTMLVEFSNTQASPRGTRLHRSLLPCLALVLALAMYPAKAHAQVEGDIEVNIPFQFHVGDAKLPAGEYHIHLLDNSDLQVMEISSADGSSSALFEVESAETKSAPAKSELVFNKYGNRYFLAQLLDEGNPSVSQVLESRYEKRISQETAEAQAHVPAHHRGQQGK